MLRNILKNTLSIITANEKLFWWSIVIAISTLLTGAAMQYMNLTETGKAALGIYGAIMLGIIGLLFWLCIFKTIGSLFRRKWKELGSAIFLLLFLLTSFILVMTYTPEVITYYLPQSEESLTAP